MLQPHLAIGVETRIIHPDAIPFLQQNDLADFILFDQKISYEFHTARVVRRNVTPLIAHTALVANPEMVRKRQERFEELWQKASPPAPASL